MLCDMGRKELGGDGEDVGRGWDIKEAVKQLAISDLVFSFFLATNPGNFVTMIVWLNQSGNASS